VEVAPTVDVRAELAWMGGTLAFQATPLGHAVREIEERFGVSVTIIDQELARRTVTGWFSTENFLTVIEVVCRVVQAICTVQGTTATISNLTP
jgi:ferric-dicitrate binding protein FerR (iron transport regulator)